MIKDKVFGRKRGQWMRETGQPYNCNSMDIGQNEILISNYMVQ